MERLHIAERILINWMTANIMAFAAIVIPAPWPVTVGLIVLAVIHGVDAIRLIVQVRKGSSAG